MKIRTQLRTPNSELRTRERAFTLVEMLLVVVIIGILAAIVLPKISGRSEQAREAAAAAQLAAFKTALNAYNVDTGTFPKGQNGLQDLLVKPNDLPSWRGPYLDSTTLPVDPWLHPYVYECPGRHNPSYDLYSLGPDGQAGTQDDVKNW